MSWALLLQPHDVLLFRDGKPFAAGADTRARSLFPPTPFTVQGAIRARMLFSSEVRPHDYVFNGSDPQVQKLREKIGFMSQNYGQLQLRGPFLVKKANEHNGQWVRYFPLPADIVKNKNDESYRVLQPLRSAILLSNLPAVESLLWVTGVNRFDEAQGWISEAGLGLYLQGQAPQKAHIEPEQEFIVRESRFGIALQLGKRTVQEGFLYTAEFLRFKDRVALWLEVEGLTPNDLGQEKGFLQLGGEARVAYYECVESRPLPTLNGSLPERFKVVLLTPAWFEQGWRPSDWQPFFTGSVHLITAMIPRYQSLGGAYVDDQRRRTNFQKPIRRFVPAGSVYYFERKGDATYTGKPFTETPAGEGDYGQIGFGCAVIGQWDYCPGGNHHV
ncbi:MAG: type III-B CRISPR module-associated protein Cmr3 [Anaerolineales bacterium]|nr:type III-B CRISPR module-associated protein Cmr3 [Anaerolineales bacterium]